MRLIRLFRFSFHLFSMGFQIDTNDRDRSLKKWADKALRILKIDVKVLGQAASREEKVIFIGNHLSILDVIVLWTMRSPAFFAHSYVEKVPLMGPFLKKLGFVFMARHANHHDKQAAFNEFTDSIRSSPYSLAIFPSGKTAMANQHPWKLGAFKASLATGVKLQPFALHYPDPKRFSFVDDESIPNSLWRLSSAAGRTVQIEFLSPETIVEPIQDCRRIKSLVDRSIELAAQAV